MKRWVMYHGNCYDGFGAAFAAWKKFGDKDTEYTPVVYGKESPAGKPVDELYLLDFSLDIGFLHAYHTMGAKKIFVLDHHVTAEKKLTPYIGTEPWLHIEFDMNRSGALIAWDYFHGKDPDWEDGCRHRDLIRHISDRDLWRFNMEGTKEIHQSLVSYPMDFDLWNTFNSLTLMREGSALLRQYENLIKNICSKSYFKQISGHKIPVVNTTIAWSEVGNKLCTMFPDYPFAASFTVFDDHIMWSLRSIGTFDVSKVAEKFGGGGHKNAAGFQTTRF